MVKDMYGNIIPKGKKARNTQYKKICEMQKTEEEKRYKESLRNSKKRANLNNLI